MTLLDFYSTTLKLDQAYWTLPDSEITLLESEADPTQLSSLIHRFSTPLIVPLDALAYYSPREADKLFGSCGHSHSTIWSGNSMIQGPLNDETISHTIRRPPYPQPTNKFQSVSSFLPPLFERKHIPPASPHPRLRSEDYVGISSKSCKRVVA